MKLHTTKNVATVVAYNTETKTVENRENVQYGRFSKKTAEHETCPKGSNLRFLEISSVEKKDVVIDVFDFEEFQDTELHTED